jgi:sucrose-6-phosphate hydrolase SacC (GH32 family)
MNSSNSFFLKLGLAILAATGAAGSPLEQATDQDSQQSGPPNAGFETGDIQGWHVLSGVAFGNRSVSDVSGGPFGQDQKYFLLGTAQAGETAVGEIKSGSFRADSVLSFLVSGGYDPDNLYVALVRSSDNRLLLKQTATNDEAFIRIVWDTKKWAGQDVHIVVHDSSTSESWGHINFDDLRVGSHALGDADDLTFQVIGQANQPPAKENMACSLYAVDPLRPQYHYTQYQGWINDPAGLIQWKGQHHLFSQYYPDSPFWGPMHWSHAVSTNSVHWRELPVALYPKKTSIPGDQSGRFTGSAMVHDDQLHLVFTDFVDLNAHPNEVQESVMVASSQDGVKFELDQRNPVIPGPGPGEPVFFRDPKVFRDPTDDSWKLVIGATTENAGRVQLYESPDPFAWEHVSVLHTGDDTMDRLWECPNFFPLEDKWVLFWGADALGWYDVGSYNGSVFTSEKQGLLDAGPASYAMQWYKDESGRNLAITWMANWRTTKWTSRANGWAGQQSITREFFLREDGGLGSRPIAELDSLASGPTKSLGSQQVGGEALAIGQSKTARLRLTAKLGATSASSIELKLFESRAESALLTYHIESRTLRLDTTNAGYAEAGTWEAVLAVPDDDKMTLDIFIDRSSLEIFAGDGTVMSALVWPRYQESAGISVAGSGGVAIFEDISLTPLGSSWC